MVLIKRKLQDSKSWTVASFIQFPLPWKKWAGLGPEIPGLKSGPTPALFHTIPYAVLSLPLTEIHRNGKSRVATQQLKLVLQKVYLQKTCFKKCLYMVWR